MVGGERCTRWLLAYAEDVRIGNVLFSSRLDPGTAAPTVWRHRLRLGAPRGHYQRHRGLPGSLDRYVPLALSSYRGKFFSRDDAGSPNRFQRVHIYRPGFRQGSHFVDGLALSVPTDHWRGIAAGLEPYCRGKYPRISQRFSTVFRHYFYVRERQGLRIPQCTDRALPVQPFPCVYAGACDCKLREERARNTTKCVCDLSQPASGSSLSQLPCADKGFRYA